MTVQQSYIVRNTSVPTATAAIPSTTTPAVPLMDKCWEPMSFFVHNWNNPVEVESSWGTSISKARDNSEQRYGFTDKPSLIQSSFLYCSTEENWRNANEMLAKQEFSRYLAPLYSDAALDCFLFDPQSHKFSTSSSLATRRFYEGQYSFITTVENKSQRSNFSCSRASVVDRTNNRLTYESSLSRSFYSAPTIDNTYTTNTGYGITGSQVIMGVNLTIVSGQMTTLIGGVGAVAGAGQSSYSANAGVGIKVGDLLVHIGCTNTKQAGSAEVLPWQLRRVNDSKTSPTSAINFSGGSGVAGWTLVSNWLENGSEGHQNVAGQTNPVSTQYINGNVIVRYLKITQAYINTLIAGGNALYQNGELLVSLDGKYITSSTHTQNAFVHATVVVRGAFVTPPTGSTVTPVASSQGIFMSHIGVDSLSGLAVKTYPAGTSFPTYVNPVTNQNFAPKASGFGFVFMSYGNTYTNNPSYSASAPTTTSALYPHTTQTANATNNVNAPKVVGTDSANPMDCFFSLFNIVENTSEPTTPVTVDRSTTFSAFYGASTPSPTVVTTVPYLFSYGLLFNPTNSDVLKIYPAIESDPSPPQQSGVFLTSTVGSVNQTAIQTTGLPALDTIESLNSLPFGFDDTVYPRYRTNTVGAFFTAPLLDGIFDYSQGLTASNVSVLLSQKEGIGRSIEGYSRTSGKTFNIKALFISRLKAWKFLEVWNNRRGQLAPVWFSNIGNTLNPISVSGNVITFSSQKGVASSPSFGGKYLYVKTNGGAVYILQVSSYTTTESSGVFTSTATISFTLSSAGAQVSGLLAAVATEITAKRIKRTTTAHLCHFGSDAIKETWSTDETMTVSFDLVESVDFKYTQTVTPPVVTTSCGCAPNCYSCSPCGALGGVQSGCPTSLGCCVCRLPALAAEMSHYCYQACWEAGDPTSPTECVPCNQATPNGSAFDNNCTISSVYTQILPLVSAESTCCVLKFRYDATNNPNGMYANLCNQSPEATLDLSTGVWNNVIQGFLEQNCCRVCMCGCQPGQLCFECLIATCDCGAMVGVNTCLLYNEYEPAIKVLCPATSCLGFVCCKTGDKCGRIKVSVKLVDTEWGSPPAVIGGCVECPATSGASCCGGAPTPAQGGFTGNGQGLLYGIPTGFTLPQ